MRRRAFIKRASGLLVPLGFPAIIRAQGIPEPILSLLNAPASAVSAGQAKANDWAARVVINGGPNPGAAEVAALGVFWDGLVTDGLDSSMIHINHVSPDSKIAFTTPFLVGGGNDPWIGRCGNNNGTTLVLGVNGAHDNGAGIANDTGILDSTAFASDNDGGMTIYVYGTVSEASRDCGYDNDALTNSFSFVSNAGGFVVANCRSQISGGIAATPGGTFQGYWSSNRTGNTVFNVYFANSGSPHASIGSSAVAESGTRQAQSFYAFGTHATDHGLGCTGFGLPTKTYSFFALHNGLSSAKSSAFFNRIQSLRTTIGGGFR